MLPSTTARSGGARLPSHWGLPRCAAFGAILVAAAIALPAAGALAASPRASHGTDEVTVFASAPAPGHPFGIAVEGDKVYVSTSAGDFFADPDNGGHKNSDGERVFVY